jgi:hypothetical protein
LELLISILSINQFSNLKGIPLPKKTTVTGNFANTKKNGSFQGTVKVRTKMEVSYSITCTREHRNTLRSVQLTMETHSFPLCYAKRKKILNKDSQPALREHENSMQRKICLTLLIQRRMESHDAHSKVMHERRLESRRQKSGSEEEKGGDVLSKWRTPRVGNREGENTGEMRGRKLATGRRSINGEGILL